MSDRLHSLLLGAALAIAALWAYQHYQDQQAKQPASPVCPCPSPPAPAPKKPAPKADPRCPNCPQLAVGQQRKPALGGTTSPDGQVAIVLQDADIDWPKNIKSRGLGCCGFRVLDYAARVQNVPELVNLPERMRQDGIAGGAYPDKVASILKKYAPERSYFSDTSGDIRVIEAMIQSKRLPCVDYSGRDPHYDQSIAHCVNVAACDVANDWVAILDNNHPQLDQIVWMSVAEFKQRWHGWVYGLLDQTPGDVAPSQAYLNLVKKSDVKDGPIFGLERQDHPWGNDHTLNGKPASIEDILASIGPAMAPIPVKVDHEVSVKDNGNLVAIGLAAAFAFWVMQSKKGGQ